MKFIKKNRILLALIILFLASLSILVTGKEKEEETLVLGVCPAPVSEPKIAACPTFYRKALILNANGFKVVLTGSTSKSLELLKEKKVDYVLSGRSLMPGEEFEYQLIDENEKRYSFLSSSSKTILSENFSEYIFYTDIPKEKIEEDLNIRNITEVQDVYNYLDEGLIITRWSNTDFSRASVVHVLNSDDSRLRSSRLAHIYYLDDCDEGIVQNIIKLIK
jgi:hypothetical protein